MKGVSAGALALAVVSVALNGQAPAPPQPVLHVGRSKIARHDTETDVATMEIASAAADSICGWLSGRGLAGLQPRLPAGTTEIYLHPATSGGFPGAAPGYRYAEELAALLDPRVRAACAGLTTGGYAAMLA